MARKKKEPVITPITETFTSPQSHTVEGATYSAQTGEVVIAFRDKKKADAATVYYTGIIHPIHWKEFKEAEHKQTYMNEVINKKYRLIRL